MKRLQLFSLAFATLLLFSQCSTNKNLTQMDSLLSKTWTLSTINGKPANAADYGKGLPFLKFASSGKLSGSTGCNSFNGKYDFDGTKMTLDPGAMTRMACPGNGEQDFITALKKITNVKADSGNMTLLNANDEVMSFTGKY